MNQAIEAYRQITVTPEFREAERLRSKARHDEAQALYNVEIKTRRDEKLGLALKLLKRKRPIDEIIEDTELSREDIENLFLGLNNN